MNVHCGCVCKRGDIVNYAGFVCGIERKRGFGKEIKKEGIKGKGKETNGGREEEEKRERKESEMR